MNKQSIIGYFLCLLLCLGNWCYGQRLNKELSENNYTVYTSIEQALKNPDEVKYLSLKKGKLRKIPSQIYMFKNLEVLDLSKNKLTEIHDSIGYLTNLVEISLANNQLTTLPVQIGHLKNLKKLIACQNEIVLLPSSVGNLQNLELLDLWSNEIVELPEEISQLKQLKFLDMRGINLSNTQKENIKQLLPKTEIEFSHGCNCLK